MEQYQLPEGDAEVLVGDMLLGEYLEEVAIGVESAKLAANWLINKLQAKLMETGASIRDLKFPSKAIGQLVGLIKSGEINSKIAQEVFSHMFDSGKLPSEIVKEKGLSQVSDLDELETFCREAIEANPGPVADFCSGKESALNFLKGQVMKASRGKANPQKVGDLLKAMIKG